MVSAVVSAPRVGLNRRARRVGGYPGAAAQVAGHGQRDGTGGDKGGVPAARAPGACRWPKGLGPAVQLIVGFVVGQQLGDVALDQRVGAGSLQPRDEWVRRR